MDVLWLVCQGTTSCYFIDNLILTPAKLLRQIFLKSQKILLDFFYLIYRVVIIRDTPLNAFLTEVLQQIEVVYKFSEILTRNITKLHVQLEAYLYFQNPSRSQSLNDKMIKMFHQLFYQSHINFNMWKKNEFYKPS